MSLPNLPKHKRNPFLIRKTKPRKAISHSPVKLSGEDLARELGPQYQTIDVRIGNQRMILDIAQGTWIHEETTIDSHDIVVLEKRKSLLEKDNNILRAKLDMILEMLAEITAEKELQQTSNK